jgi:hypothetical protein
VEDLLKADYHVCRRLRCSGCYVGASFDNWLNAVDGSFCTFEGGNDPTQVKLLLPLAPTIYHLTYHIG